MNGKPPYEVFELGGRRYVMVTGRDPLFQGIYRGYFCDGASTPRWLRWLLGSPFAEPCVKPCIRHDFRYEFRVGSRRDADAGLREDLLSCGASRLRAWTYWFWVRVFGWSHWGRPTV